MLDKGKLVVAAVLFVALNYTVTAELLDLAPDAVDDMYTGCREKALEKFVHSDLLKEELEKDDKFQAAWDANNSSDCSELRGGTKEHTTALRTYDDLNAHPDSVLLRTFNDAVKTKGTNVSTYEDHFPFKSFHFLLMDSIRLLHPKQECQTVYAISEEKFTDRKFTGLQTQTKGSNVRFGEFVLANSRFQDKLPVKFRRDWTSELRYFVGYFVFNITSCFFANLGNNICRHEDTVLLSPAEVFTVEKEEKKIDLEGVEYTEIVLKHSKLDSTHNCYIFSWSPADVPPPKLVLVLLALSLCSLTEGTWYL